MKPPHGSASPAGKKNNSNKPFKKDGISHSPKKTGFQKKSNGASSSTGIQKFKPAFKSRGASGGASGKKVAANSGSGATAAPGKKVSVIKASKPHFKLVSRIQFFELSRAGGWV